MNKGMSQPHFTFVLSTEKKRNCLIKLFNSGICHFHYLKSILNDDSFKEYIKPMVSINLKTYATTKTVYSCNCCHEHLPKAATERCSLKSTKI